MGVDTSASTVTARVTLGTIGGGAYGIAVELSVARPVIELDVVDQVISAAHDVCAYSNATRGNIEVVLTAM